MLPLDNHYLVFNFKYEAENLLGSWDKLSEATNYGPDKSKWPFIDIQTSIFENLNQGRAMTHISLVDDDYYWTYIAEMPVDAAYGKRHPYMDHHGAVLNIQSFPGKIDFINNIVRYNMYFINDVFPKYRGTKITESVLNLFLNNNQIQTVKCENDGGKVRFFGDYLNSFTE